VRSGSLIIRTKQAKTIVVAGSPAGKRERADPTRGEVARGTEARSITSQQAGRLA
jgi:hypothetical protein